LIRAEQRDAGCHHRGDAVAFLVDRTIYMAHTTVRVSEATRDQLRRLAAAEKKPMRAIIAAAIEAYRRERFLGAVNKGYAAVRDDPVAWATVLEEREAWDDVLLDGLPGEDDTAPPARDKGPRRRRPRPAR
jgi:predicted transcriptional regulator